MNKLLKIIVSLVQIGGGLFGLGLIGRCFLEKEYLAPAIDTFREAIESHEIKGDELSKELNYWLGRSLEADERPDEAVKIYGQLIQWDFKYRDVRARMDALRKK